MNQPLAAAALVLASLTTGAAFAQSAPDQMSNEVAAGSTAAPTNSSTSRDQVLNDMQRAQQQPHDQIDNEVSAGAASSRPSKLSVLRSEVRDAFKRAQKQPHTEMDTERAAWG